MAIRAIQPLDPSIQKMLLERKSSPQKSKSDMDLKQFLKEKKISQRKLGTELQDVS